MSTELGTPFRNKLPKYSNKDFSTVSERLVIKLLPATQKIMQNFMEKEIEKKLTKILMFFFSILKI